MSYTEKDQVRSISLSFGHDGSMEMVAHVESVLVDADGKTVAVKPGSIAVNRAFQPGDEMPIDAIYQAVLDFHAEDAERLRKHLEDEAAKAAEAERAAKELLVKEAAEAQAKADELAAKAAG